MTYPVAGRCGFCRHFTNDGATLEASFPGLVAMGSGFASVRASDGICRLEGLYLSARAGCHRFEASQHRSPLVPDRMAIGRVLARTIAARLRKSGHSAAS
jgi:hypothetical protein